MAEDMKNVMQVLNRRSRLQEARADTTCLLLCKLASIVESNEKPIMTFMDELAHDPQRAEQVMHSLIGLLVQYAERSGGYLRLCNYLSSQLNEDSPMPGMAERDRNWAT